ncbi:MAG: hemolysin family protein [Vigna little leaf phytoplasma]|nr:hemolysin family protein [Vigna little leaf phytoplasma]
MEPDAGLLLLFQIIFLILLNSFFAAMEIALVSLSESKINLEIKKKNPKALKIKKIKETPTYFLSVIQIMIHIITFIQGSLIADKNLLIQANVIVCSIIFGEILPKRISLAFPLKTAYLFASIFRLIYILAIPFVWLLNHISDMILFVLQKIFQIDFNQKTDSVTEDELRFLLTSSYRKGIINSHENNMIQNIFDFSGTVVSDIMRHRKEIIAMRSDITKDELIKFISREKYTRFPVYKENIDHIIGIIHVKDIFKGLIDINGELEKISKKNSTEKDHIVPKKTIIKEKFDIHAFLRKPYYVMEFKHISELFKEMQIKQNHIAIVLDEYGGTAGIVTIEDMIEEILGEIQDEYDKKSVDILKISNTEYITRGTTHLNEIEEYLNADLPINDYETISGFMLGQLNRIPERHEQIKVIYNQWRFEGLVYNGLVISKVKITKENPILSKEK